MNWVYADKNFFVNAENEAMTTIITNYINIHLFQDLVTNMEKQDKMPIFFNREYKLINLFVKFYNIFLINHISLNHEINEQN